LFAGTGRPAEAPGRLAVVVVLQFAEGLSDRQAAEAVRSRIDWKYLLGWELTDAGFECSALSAFRTRLGEHGGAQQLLDTLLERFKARGVLKARGRQRTDSTHVLAAIRTLNRLECVGETWRQALNAVATVAPEWLRAQVPAEWATRYGPRFEAYRLPKTPVERQALAEQIGADGAQLWAWLWAADAPATARTLPAVEVLRQVWVQQYYEEVGHVQWRTADNLPPPAQLIQSPYDPAARYGHKRDTTWTGYKVHLTETCEPTAPHLLTQVATTVMS
jgi:transposase